MNVALEQFKKHTGYDIKSYFEDFVLLCSSYYPLIVNYYNGNELNSVGKAFNLLDELLSKSNQIESLFQLKFNSFTTTDAWELLDAFTECQTKLWTINNSSRWLRSAILGRYGNNTVISRTLKTNETFEDVASNLGLSDPQNDWLGIAKNNFVEEENYDMYNGIDRNFLLEGQMKHTSLFQINLNTTGNSTIDNIVDNLSEKKILGKDIKADFKFTREPPKSVQSAYSSSDFFDVATVEFDDAIEQSFNTIINCLKGSIPEFPEYGLPNEMIGSSINAIQYPKIFRDLLNMFQRDGRWEEVNLLDIYRLEDNIFIKINAKTVTNNTIVTDIQI